MLSSLMEQDPEIGRAIRNEVERQRSNINLIASENFASAAVLEAQGSVFTNKYAEGYPGRRYYGGCEFVDVAERLAIGRAKTLFGAEHANVQPHSGAQANMAAYFATLQPGDTIMGMSLDQGGHLTHGASVNFSAKIYDVVQYGVDRETEVIDYDEVERLAREHRPKLIVVGASAYTRIIDFPRFRDIADDVGAKVMVDMAHIAGLVAADEHPSPCRMRRLLRRLRTRRCADRGGGMILCDDEHRRAINSAVFPNMQGGPLEHIIAAKAVAFGEAMQPEFVEYQKGIRANAVALADELRTGGLRLVSGGTDNHIVLVDLTPMEITGRQAEEALGEANIVVNRNAIPFDQKPPRTASGLRLGTPSITSRGFGVEETRQVGRLILRALGNIGSDAVKGEVRDEAMGLCARFPAPGLD